MGEDAGKRWTRPVAPYFAVLDRIQRHLLPRAYLEIGVHRGTSLAMALPGTLAVGVDPAPLLRSPSRRWARVHPVTSDAFFAANEEAQALEGRPLDLAFIDGMHQFGFALRDFMHIEGWSHPGTTVLVHDCYPADALGASPVRTTAGWSGDVWKLIVCLKAERPDLDVHVVDVGPTGLGIVGGLDPSSTHLAEDYDAVLARYEGLEFSWLEERGRAETLNRVDPDWPSVRGLLPAVPWRAGAPAWLRVRRSLRPAHWPYVADDLGYRARAGLSRLRARRPAGAGAGAGAPVRTGDRHEG
ncbi:MAG TPA: class I SAM-dependent methyltransferase [Acidimicrobiales bacterium]|nr:class I SAM-dependent methyltransferase [Acidimicrobiales bacterium]